MTLKVSSPVPAFSAFFLHETKKIEAAIKAEQTIGAKILIFMALTIADLRRLGYILFPGRILRFLEELIMQQTDKRRLASMIDHTNLRPTACSADIERLCREAIEFGFASVCVNPVHVPLAAALLRGSGVKVCTVVGFPLGATSHKAKAAEAARAVADGAEEVDMVVDICAVKERRPRDVEDDVSLVVNAAAPAIVKVILETCYLTDEEIVLACEAAVKSGAAFVKTSTGFGSGGATVEAVSLMRRTVGNKAGVKAAGGIRTAEDALAMVAAGADRLGCSAGVAICSRQDGIS